ncbi:MAG: PTS sugar transporter subunit IIC [Sebaldella sp.]|nr:PTS sugar transporter subunit IIC [Sebaldella sp.]
MKINFFTFMEQHLMGPMSKIANQKHLMAVRNGMISTIPLTIIGSFFLILAAPPLDPAYLEKIHYAQRFGANFALVFRLSMGIIAVYATYNIGYYLAKSYNLDGVSAGTLSLLAFMMTHIPLLMNITNGTVQTKAWFIPMGNLGSAGIFGGILIAFFSVEVLRFFKNHRLVIKMPDGVPEAVGRSFESLFPTIFVVIVIYLVSIHFRVDIHKLLYGLFHPLIRIVNHPAGVIAIVLLITLLWACGIHGVAIIGSVARPIWLILLEQNGSALESGAKILPNVGAEPFYQWFIWIGGSGCTIGLMLLMVFSKSKQLKSLGRIAFLPGIFNINEPIIFGTPIMLNPFLIIPFMLAPITTALLSYFAMATNMVSRVSTLPPWTFPAPLGAYLATNGDPRAIILVFINIIISIVIYFPFFKLYEKKLLSDELKSVELENNEKIESGKN